MLKIQALFVPMKLKTFVLKYFSFGGGGRRQANAQKRKKQGDQISCLPDYMQHMNPCLWEDGS